MTCSKRWLPTTSLILLLCLLVGWSYSPPSPATLITQPLALTPTPAKTPLAGSDDLSFVPSLDGRWTAIINSTAGSLDLQQPDGTTLNIFPPESTVHEVTWSPDSRHLLVIQTHWIFNEPRGTGVEASGPIEIWAIRVEDGQAQPPARLFQAETGGDEGVEGPAQILFGQWAPDSQHILFWLGPLGASILADGLPSFVLNVNNGQTTRIADWALVNSRYHSWAPDGSALALTAGGYRSAQVSKWLNLFEIDTGQVTTVVSQTEQIPGIVAWSPQGNLIAYAAVPASQTGQEWADLATFDNPAIAGRRIYLLDPLTGQSRRLNQASSFQDAPLWNEDGSLLYYVQRQGNQLQLMVTNLTGQASAVEGAAIPLPEFVGYYGQSDLGALLAQRPGGELGALAPAESLSTPVPPPPSADDLAVLRFIFEHHRPELGTLTTEFLEDVAQGEYTDFTRQEVDLSGDGQPEILVSGSALSTHLFVAILDRTSTGALKELFYTASNEGKYFAQVRTTVEKQRVIADFLTYTGGTGYLEMVWEQRWIECQGQACNLVWSSPLLIADRSVNLSLERHYAVTEIEALDQQRTQQVTRRFGLAIPILVEDEAPAGGARRFLGPNTMAIYHRSDTAEEYRLENQVQLEAGLEITREFSQETLETNQLVYELTSQPFFGADGLFDNQGFNQLWAEVWDLPLQEQPEDPTWGYSRAQADVAAHTGSSGQLGEWFAGMIGASHSPQCRLTVQHQVAGKFKGIGRVDLPCTINFSRLAWVEVTGDGLEELLLITIPPEVEAGGQLQRLYLFSIAGDRLLELATLEGYINGADGAGIRWTKGDSGFQVEAGLPLVDLDNFPTLEEINLIRQFQTYEWDNRSRSFQALN